MRSLMLALSLISLPTLEASEGHSHALQAHEHGVAQLNVVLEAGQLDIELETPAANLLGFEHSPRSAKEQQQLQSLKTALENPFSLLSLPSAAACTLSARTLEGGLLEEAAKTASTSAQESHSELHLSYRLNCQHPEQLKVLSLAPFFQRFPATRQLLVQLIGPQGQQGITATPGKPQLNF